MKMPAAELKQSGNKRLLLPNSSRPRLRPKRHAKPPKTPIARDS